MRKPHHVRSPASGTSFRRRQTAVGTLVTPVSQFRLPHPLATCLSGPGPHAAAAGEISPAVVVDPALQRGWWSDEADVASARTLPELLKFRSREVLANSSGRPVVPGCWYPLLEEYTRALVVFEEPCEIGSSPVSTIDRVFKYCPKSDRRETYPVLPEDHGPWGCPRPPPSPRRPGTQG